jgi:hypothetical protein
MQHQLRYRYFPVWIGYHLVQSREGETPLHQSPSGVEAWLNRTVHGAAHVGAAAAVGGELEPVLAMGQHTTTGGHGPTDPIRVTEEMEAIAAATTAADSAGAAWAAAVAAVGAGEGGGAGTTVGAESTL